MRPFISTLGGSRNGTLRQWHTVPISAEVLLNMTRHDVTVWYEKEEEDTTECHLPSSSLYLKISNQAGPHVSTSYMESSTATLHFDPD